MDYSAEACLWAGKIDFHWALATSLKQFKGIIRGYKWQKREGNVKPRYIAVATVSPQNRIRMKENNDQDLTEKICFKDASTVK